jgi:hypothetical protein
VCPPQINITHLGFNPRIALCRQHQLPETVQTLAAAEGILVMPGSIWCRAVSLCSRVTCLGFWLVMSTHCNHTVLTSCDWLLESGMRPHGLVCFPPPSCYYTGHTHLSQALVFYSVRLTALLLCGMRLSFSCLMHFVLPKCLCFIKNWLLCC